MGNGILGHSTTGWFARLAGVLEAAGRGALNVVSFGGRAGDRLYDGMHTAADRYVQSVNDEAIKKAVATGKTEQQALAVANKELEKIANPQGVEEVSGLLLGTGPQVAARGGVEAVYPSKSQSSFWQQMMAGIGKMLSSLNIVSVIGAVLIAAVSMVFMHPAAAVGLGALGLFAAKPLYEGGKQLFTSATQKMAKGSEPATATSPEPAPTIKPAATEVKNDMQIEVPKTPAKPAATPGQQPPQPQQQER